MNLLHPPWPQTWCVAAKDCWALALAAAAQVSSGTYKKSMVSPKRLASADPFGHSPLMVCEQHGSKLGELLRRILERREHDSPLVDRKREQLDVVVDARSSRSANSSAPVALKVVGELRDCVDKDWDAREHHTEQARLQANCAGELRQHSPQRAPIENHALVMWLRDESQVALGHHARVHRRGSGLRHAPIMRLLDRDHKVALSTNRDVRSIISTLVPM